MMKLLLTAVGFLLIAISAAAEPAKATAELIFASAIEISPRERITLYDLVETRGASTELIESLKSRKVKYQDNIKSIFKNILLKISF